VPSHAAGRSSRDAKHAAAFSIDRLSGELISAGASPAAAQSGCAGIADRDARLACFDRAAPAPARGAPSAGSACTRGSPCIGPRSGVYYFTASGAKRYLPR
jgi:hypothetical protein